MPPKRPSRVLVALVAALSLLAVSCSDDDGADVRDLDSDATETDSGSGSGSGSGSEPGE
jgi:hypothetical protein